MYVAFNGQLLRKIITLMALAWVSGDKGFSFFEVRACLWMTEGLGVTGLVSCFNHGWSLRAYLS